MATTERYTTIIELNSEQAKHQLDELRKKVESWKDDLAEAREKKMGKSFIASIRKELAAAEKELKKYDNEVARTIETMNDLHSASVERLEEAQKGLLRLSKEVPHDSPFYEKLNGMLDQVTQELEDIKAMKAFEQLQQEAKGATKSAEQLKAELEFIKQTAENAETVSLKQLELAERTAENIKDSAEKSSDEWKQASAGLETIRTRLSAIEEEERKVVSTIDRYEKEIKEANKSIETTEREMKLVNQTLDKLSSASVRDIEYSIKILNEQLRDTERTGDNVEALTEKLKKLNEELRKVQDMQRPDKKKGNIFTRGIDFLNDNWGAITQVISSITGLSATVRDCVAAFADMDQEMADVRKYTGQSTEEVESMNEAFKKMDTRTSREQLNQLAGSAGRLGITSTSAVLEFVDAADKIGVALGDDLGKGAVDKIGKLAMAFGEDDRMGLRGAMLATGSAVNELAQNSAAQAGYLVDFAARLSGIGVQAGLTQAQILGLGAAMDENMQKDEMAATAISQIITKMTTDSETFARIAGKNVEEFANLVKTDMNAALMQFFEAMNKKGGFAELAPLFEQMGLDGTRAIGVLSTLAAKIDDVRKHQQLAAEAYREGTSVVDEFNVQNKTYQAGLEKARKAFNDLKVELGERLLPVVTLTISSGGLMVKALSAIASFALKFRTTIIMLTVAIAALTAAKYADIIATKWQNFWNVTLIGNLKKLWAVISANPYAAAAMAAAALVGIIADLVRRSNEATVAQRALNEVNRETTRRIDDEKTHLDLLIDTINSSTASEGMRKKALEELNGRLMEMHLGNLTEEDVRTGKATETLNKYNQELAKRIRLQVLEEEMKKSVERQRQAEQGELEPSWGEVMEEAFRIPTPWNPTKTSAQLKDEANKRAIQEEAERQAKLQEEMDDILGGTLDEFRSYVWNNLAGDPDRNGNASGGSGYDSRSYWEQELKDRRARLKALRDDATATAADIEAAAKKVKEAEGKMELFTGRKAGYKEERAEDKARRERERKANDAAKAETEQQLAELTHRYAMGQILYCDYVDEQERIQLEGIERRMLIYRTESLEYQKLNRKREELLLNGSEESQKLSLAQMKHGHEQRLAAIEEQAWRENWTERKKNEELFLENDNYLKSQRILYRKGTLERINLEREIEENDQNDKLQRQQYYQQQLEQAREQLLQMGNERVMQLELKNIEEVYDYMIKQGVAKETEKQEAILAVKAKYATYQSQTDRDQQAGSNALNTAQDNARRQLDQKAASGGSPAASLPFVGDIMLYQSTMEQLRQMYQSDEITHAQYLAAKAKAEEDFCNGLTTKMQAAYNTVNQVMSAASNYFSAQQDYETALVQRKYEKQIEAAGSNQKKVKKLQEKQQKEEAAIKTKYARRAATIQMAQAVAQTAISAINAYSSAAAIPVTGHILAPIAAAAAIAAGMIQIATIKKQQQAQEAGYYGGGFTGGRRYRREAGVVHEGEFVANHQAVGNPAILPFLNFLDQAQRNNTVGSLTAADVSRQLSASGGSPAGNPVITPIVNVQTDNEQLRSTLSDTRDVIDRLATQLEQGIGVDVPIDGENGIYRQLRRYESLLKNK